MVTKKILFLTKKEIELLQQALGIAEKKCSDLHTELINKIISVRGYLNSARESQKDFAFHWHSLSCDFSDLNINISAQIIKKP